MNDQQKTSPGAEELLLYRDDGEALRRALDRMLGALGLARNAGGLAVGSEAVALALRRKKAKLAFAASDISEHSLKALCAGLRAARTQYIILPCDKATLAKRLGKSGFVSCAAITKKGFDQIVFRCMDRAKTAIANDFTTEVQ